MIAIQCVLNQIMSHEEIKCLMLHSMLQRLTISSISNDVEQLQFSYIADGTVECYTANLENQLAVSHQIKHTFNGLFWLVNTMHYIDDEL